MKEINHRVLSKKPHRKQRQTGILSTTNARITVKRGAAGNDMLVLNSSICRSSTMNTNI